MCKNEKFHGIHTNFEISQSSVFRFRTRISSSSSSSDEDFSIKRSVARNHLTANNARTIIKSVVSNEFVIAAVQQRADELERQLKERKEKISETLLRELPDGQKMTRNRAREFNHSTLPICDLNAVEPDQLIKNLISSNLHEEDDPVGDDDDEYKPHFEEEDDVSPKLVKITFALHLFSLSLLFQSDEYSSATCSDIESQPQTPLTSSKYDTEVRMVRYDHKEGIFKLPQSPSVVKTPNRTTEETISRRTRSQVSLVSKTIEGIQQPLIPMDLPQEYGETEFEPDHNWEDFLDQFQKPLEAIDGEEGEETDPEYVCNETANTETLADSIVVTKREADSLLQEIYDELERDLESSFPTETFRATSSPNKNYYPSESMVESLPISEVDQGVENITESTIEVQKSEPIAIIPYEAQVDSQLLPATSTQTNFNIIQGTDDKMYLLPSISSQSEAKLKTAFLEINVSEDLPTIMAKIRHQKELHYQNVHKESLQLNGWTAKSLRIFHRQLMVHVQLLGQMFVQTYSHPKLWADAKHHKRLLKDLWKRRESNSVLNCLCWNLPDMMVICRDWERELSVESEENQDYVRALMSGGHHDRVLERIVNSRAFMFEEYLPATAAITFHVNTRCVPARVLLFIVFLRNRNVRTSKGSIMYKSFVAFKKRYGEKRAACHYYQLLTYETVKKYLRTGEVPQLPFKEIEYERYETYENVVPIVARTIGKWPKPWKDIVKKQRLMVKEKRNANEKEKEVPVTVTMNFPMFKAEIAVPNRPVYYGIGDEVPESEDDPSITDDEGVCVEDSLERVNEEKRKVPVKKRKHGGKPNLGGNLVGMIKKALRKKKKCQKGRRRIGQYLTKILERKRVTKKFSTLLRDTDYKYDLNMGSLVPNLISTKIFNYLKEFDLFARVLFARSCQNRNSRLKHAPLRKLDVKTEIYNPQPSLPSQPSTTEATIEKDPFFAWKYVGVVERTVGEGFEQFVQVLKRLKLGSSSVVDLYLVSTRVLKYSKFPFSNKLQMIFLGN